jgi:hypothetical protein
MPKIPKIYKKIVKNALRCFNTVKDYQALRKAFRELFKNVISFYVEEEGRTAGLRTPEPAAAAIPSSPEPAFSPVEEEEEKSRTPSPSPPPPPPPQRWEATPGPWSWALVATLESPVDSESYGNRIRDIFALVTSQHLHETFFKYQIQLSKISYRYYILLSIPVLQILDVYPGYRIQQEKARVPNPDPDPL